jgi:hypothetical protein
MPTRYYDEPISKDMNWVYSTHVVEFWWQNELEMLYRKPMGRTWNILCLFAILKKTVMAEDIYALSVVQLEFFFLGYCVPSLIGGQNLGTALWSHLQGSIAQRPFLDIDQRNREENNG